MKYGLTLRLHWALRVIVLVVIARVLHLVLELPAGADAIAALGVVNLAIADESAAPTSEPSEWISLFDGQSLDGWVRHGDSRQSYQVEDGCIVGSSAPGTRNAFLCTARNFGDFELELELRVDAQLNSGVQIRSHVDAQGRVYGYQVEVDPSARKWSGGIYDEGRRGWLDDLDDNEGAQQAFQPDQWNHYRIVAIGDHIRTWVNGVAAADLHDPLTSSGFIGLQVHGTPHKEPMRIRWRNIRLRDRGRHEWTRVDWQGAPGWEHVDGLLRASSTVQGPAATLFSPSQLQGLVARVTYRLLEGEAALIWGTRPSSTHPNDATAAEPSALRLSLRRDELGSVTRIPSGEVVAPAQPGDATGLDLNGWNDVTVADDGTRLTLHTNGRHRYSETRTAGTRRLSSICCELRGIATLELRRVECLQPARSCQDRLRALITAPPAQATKLLDGELATLWTGPGVAHWSAGPDEIQIQPGSGSIETRRSYEDFVLHVEFQLPEDPGDSGNSGIYLQKRYEIQILNSSPEDTPEETGCGAIYRYRAPNINAARPPGEWQSYDILFRHSRWRLPNALGEKSDSARVTVIHNGRVIHDDVEVSRKTGAGDAEGAEGGPILLQDHGSAVKFRNLWIAPL